MHIGVMPHEDEGIDSGDSSTSQGTLRITSNTRAGREA